jgi:voltage-gated potassium channel Kch
MAGTRVPGRRWRVAASLTRTIVITALLLAVYYSAPLDRPVDFRIGVWLATGLVALAGAVGWQARAIAMSDMPRLRAVETAAAGLGALLILYASIYVVMSHDEPGSFTEVLGRTDALYYTMTVFATVGFGDITPVTESTRIVTMTQMLVGILAVGLGVKILLGAVQDAVARGAAAERPSVDPAARSEQAE